ncbi:MAG: hypothetical protein JSS30_00980 [Verrucomicrobia bacterium]|nr:hypothetical protein [Verrucomicrobiota bacterium]
MVPALFLFLSSPTIEPIAYCNPLDALCPEYCTTPCGEEECALLMQISPESRRLYNTLDCEGKNRAIELSICYCDKDCAVEEAAYEMYCRQRGQYPNLEEYEEQIEDESGQNSYNRRFGY